MGNNNNQAGTSSLTVNLCADGGPVIIHGWAKHILCYFLLISALFPPKVLTRMGSSLGEEARSMRLDFQAGITM